MVLFPGRLARPLAVSLFAENLLPPDLWAESNCGGFWGPELRFCGYDGFGLRESQETNLSLVK